MTNTPVSPESIRSALLERDFSLAESLIAEWGRMVSHAVRWAANEAEKQSVLEAARVEGENNLYLAQVMRAQVAAELRSHSASVLYADFELETPRWRFNA